MNLISALNRFIFVFLFLQTYVMNGRNNYYNEILPSIINLDTLPYKIISRGGDAGDYQAVPDACRLKNGDIVVLFYAGDNHVTFPGDKYPKSGRICLVRSKDDGRTWSKPVVIYDDIYDNRDPHITQLSNGTLICSFFSLRFDIPDLQERKSKEPSYTKEQIARFGNNPDLLKDQKPVITGNKNGQVNAPQRKWAGVGPFIIKSHNNGRSWDKKAKKVPASTPGWYCSAKVREMPDGTCLLPVYHSEPSGRAAWGGVIPSYDKCKTWGKEIPIGKEANTVLAAETDIILLSDNTLFAALRGDGSRVNMHYATSNDMGKSWSPVINSGFVGHAPSFTRLSSGEILLSYRAHDPESGYYTGLRISYDEAKSFEGPYLIDVKVGGYPSTVELKDGSVLIIYYEEGERSAIRALRFKKPEPKSVIEFHKPEQVDTLPLD